MTKSRHSHARAKASDSDRRFALLVAMLIGPERPGGLHGQRKAGCRPENEERVRAGATGHNVRYVLFGSLALVITLFIIVWLVRPQAEIRHRKPEIRNRSRKASLSSGFWLRLPDPAGGARRKTEIGSRNA